MGIEWHGAQRNGRREAEFTMNSSQGNSRSETRPFAVRRPSTRKLLNRKASFVIGVIVAKNKYQRPRGRITSDALGTQMNHKNESQPEAHDSTGIESKQSNHF